MSEQVNARQLEFPIITPEQRLLVAQLIAQGWPPKQIARAIKMLDDQS
jgi:hypothetical protein